MKTMNFYTQNGWAGSNYDSNLSTKEIASKVRSYAKKNFPGFKFSIRSIWSMYADSLVIELKSGTCAPFVEGSKSAGRGYMQTMSTVKPWEKDLTPEVFSVMDALTTYANSFCYDDSDGTQDYFDTNFYLKIEISDEYQIVEPKGKKKDINEDKKQGNSNTVGQVQSEGLEVVDYSEKAIAVFGDTKPVKEQLKELGGRFNPSLNYNGGKRAGWIFSKKHSEKVREIIYPTLLTALPDKINNKNKIYTREAYDMKVEAYFKDEDKFIPRGEYKETELDKQKKKADILCTSIDGNYYTLCLQKPIEVEGRCVKRYNDKVISVTKSVYNKLEAKYNIMCDF